MRTRRVICNSRQMKLAGLLECRLGGCPARQLPRLLGESRTGRPGKKHQTDIGVRSTCAESHASLNLSKVAGNPEAADGYSTPADDDQLEAALKIPEGAIAAPTAAAPAAAVASVHQAEMVESPRRMAASWPTKDVNATLGIHGQTSSAAGGKPSGAIIGEEIGGSRSDDSEPSVAADAVDDSEKVQWRQWRGRWQKRCAGCHSWNWHYTTTCARCSAWVGTE